LTDLIQSLDQTVTDLTSFFRIYVDDVTCVSAYWRQLVFLYNF